MKKQFSFALIIIYCVTAFNAMAQNIEPPTLQMSSDLLSAKNEEPEITTQQYAIIEQRIQSNAQQFGLDKMVDRINIVSLQWPLKAATGFNDCGFYVVSAYVDHDTTTSFHDYNNGTVTYNGHRGTDIATFPFHFYKMDSNQVEVVAAGAGTIIDKHDGEYDRNCVGVGSGLIANYIIIQHADGSEALYWHMKSGKVTTKTIGQTVVAGEYLGVVGSSGSSSGPHLHFEVWSGNTAATLVDPFAGPNNTWNLTSWWTNQKPHEEPAVLKASVHTTDVDFATCPISETPNESTYYTIPFQGPGLSPGYAKFYVFLRNVTTGGVINLQIKNANGTVYSATGNPWSYTLPTSGLYYTLAYSKKLPTVAGTFTFEATYNGISCSQSFDIVTATGVEEQAQLSQFNYYPNPAAHDISVSVFNLVNGIYHFKLKNTIGQVIMDKQITIENNALQKTFSITDQINGIYFMSLESDKINMVKKIIKQQY